MQPPATAPTPMAAAPHSMASAPTPGLHPSLASHPSNLAAPAATVPAATLFRAPDVAGQQNEEKRAAEQAANEGRWQTYLQAYDYARLKFSSGTTVPVNPTKESPAYMLCLVVACLRHSEQARARGDTETAKSCRQWAQDWRNALAYPAIIVHYNKAPQPQMVYSDFTFAQTKQPDLKDAKIMYTLPDLNSPEPRVISLEDITKTPDPELYCVGLFEGAVK